MVFHYVMILLSLTEILSIGVHSCPLSLLFYVRASALGLLLLFPSSDHCGNGSGDSSNSSKSSTKKRWLWVDLGGGEVERMIGERVDKEKEKGRKLGTAVKWGKLSIIREKRFRRKSISSFIHSFFLSVRFQAALLLAHWPLGLPGSLCEARV